MQAARSHWFVVPRRITEGLAGAIVMIGVLFIPIALSIPKLYLWANPPPGLSAQTLELLAHKRPWLNSPFFLTRAAVFFVFWSVVALLLLHWSRSQDDGWRPGLTVSQRRLGAGALPALGITFTAGAFDWLMSLDPTWYSTIFGLYVFAGGFLSAMALLIISIYLAERAGALRGLLTVSHYHSMGKLLFAFVCFWGYIGFSQLLLQWIANLPDEISFFKARRAGGWYALELFLIFGHFFLPFFALLSRNRKRTPRRLVAWAVYLLCAHFIDTWWTIAPFKEPRLTLHWQSLTALAGVGGLTLAFSILLLRRGYLAPVGDPYFEESVRFAK
jgi:hypothetical protein